MEFQSLSTINVLTAAQRAALRRGNIVTVADLMILNLPDVMKKCRLQMQDAQDLVDIVCRQLMPEPRRLDDPSIRSEMFSTGDETLDAAIGGGVRTGMVWEVVGESAAGKTQLSLQLSLFVQIPRSLGGLAGSACFLSTSWTLPTNRLLEIIDTHPRLSPAVAGLADIHTMKIPTISTLLHVLSKMLPTFLEETMSHREAKPVKLLIIDALTELFHIDSKTNMSTLAQRSKDLAEISTLLHIIANKYGLAVLVLNEVSDYFDRSMDANIDLGQEGEMLYRDQARFFNRADSIPGEDLKEAALGLVWANQVNVRIMLSRTDRVSHIDPDIEATRPAKRRRLDPGSSSLSRTETEMRLRRMTVIFSSVSPPTSLDYIVTGQGVSVVPNEEQFNHTHVPGPSSRAALVTSASTSKSPIRPTPAHLRLQHDDPTLLNSSQSIIPTFEGLQSDPDPQISSSLEDGDPENGPRPEEEEDEWEEYWRKHEMDDTDFDIDLPSTNVVPDASLSEPYTHS